MGFIDKEDFSQCIEEGLLDSITEVDDNKLQAAISFAIRYAEGLLNARYDTATIFNQTGSDRDEVILGHVLDIAIYRLHSRINPRKKPKHRIESYQDAKEWFEKVNKGEINPPGLPQIQDDDTRDYFKFGGNPKRENHF
jgi:phage gp36-like protein